SFFQAEDGIRDRNVTGVQTCALPILIGSEGTMIHCQVVVIAGGLGCFEPRKPALENLDRYEGKSVHYMVKDPEKFRGKKVVIARSEERRVGKEGRGRWGVGEEHEERW